MIDHEHGAFDLETIADLAGWFQATDVSAIVRIHKSFTHEIGRFLDQGMMGVQVSDVDTADEARAIVAEAKFPPIGRRGISGQGMHTGYKSYGAGHASEQLSDQAGDIHGWSPGCRVSLQVSLLGRTSSALLPSMVARLDPFFGPWLKLAVGPISAPAGIAAGR